MIIIWRIIVDFNGLGEKCVGFSDETLRYRKCITHRIWEKIGDIPIDVGIRDSRDNTRRWEMLGSIIRLENSVIV